MGIVRSDLSNPPELTDEQLARLDAMTPEQIERNAEEDSDNPPLTEDELERVAIAREVQGIRKARGMSQTVFAATYSIAVSRLRDWEQGRFTPDAMARAYLDTIRFEPDAVSRAREARDRYEVAQRRR